jgi:hypothetical protein
MHSECWGKRASTAIESRSAAHSRTDRLDSHACDWGARAHGALEFSRLATVAFGALCVYDLFDERLHNGDMASETRL